MAHMHSCMKYDFSTFVKFVTGYCKSGSIHGALIFEIFAQNWVSANSLEFI